jgi:hypothetical protein|tara:strand:+ start:271 stop:405 length:135 start_codon:yes stop_codon:yes gene_type:complete
MAKVIKYLKSFISTIGFMGLPLLALQHFFGKGAPNGWDYGLFLF